MKLFHAADDYIEVKSGEVTLLRYVYRPALPAIEAPNPYFHPIRTRAGHVVTGFRPHDHRWHHGLSFTCANLSGENFWGGPTYVEGKGYVQLPNVGRQRHVAWERIAAHEHGVDLREQLQWITEAGAHWLDETRSIRIPTSEAAADYWSLELEFELTNVTTEPLVFGSPTTAGRPMAGYGGLFWRGPREFQGGDVIAVGDGRRPECAPGSVAAELGLGPRELNEAESIMGRRAYLLAYTGRHDGVDAASTLVFYDGPTNPRHPTQWFVRDTVPMVCAAFMFDRTLVLGPGERLHLRYTVVIADGPERERILAEVDPSFT